MSDGDPEKNDGDRDGDGPHGTGIDARGSPNPPPPPADNDRAVGNDGGPPEGAMNNLQHGLYADPVNVMAHLKEEDPDAYAWIQAKAEGYLTDAPFDAGSPKTEQLRQIATREYAI